MDRRAIISSVFLSFALIAISAYVNTCAISRQGPLDTADSIGERGWGRSQGVRYELAEWMRREGRKRSRSRDREAAARAAIYASFLDASSASEEKDGIE